jgi:hydroxymethylpyrimidine/phosphomethylpyrimidine kinase
VNQVNPLVIKAALLENQDNLQVIKVVLHVNQVNPQVIKVVIGVKKEHHLVTKEKDQAIKAGITPLKNVILNFIF